MTPDERRVAARNAAIARWRRRDEGLPVAQHGSEDRPLRIGEIEIPCYVLSDGRRVLSQRGLQSGVGMSEGGGKSGARKLVEFLLLLETKGIDTKGLTARANEPIHFLRSSGRSADGYEATILPDICAVVLDAANQGKLLKSQLHFAEQCRILLQGFGQIGIIALVDEATGYQDFRQANALSIIIEKFIAKELRPWVRTFPAEFYKQMYRLKGWTYSADTQARPRVIGTHTNDIIYDRLAPGVLPKLKAITPRDAKGRAKHKYFQRLTDDIGHPKLMERLAAVVMLQKYSPDWDTFMARLDDEFPRWDKTMKLKFD